MTEDHERLLSAVRLHGHDGRHGADCDECSEWQATVECHRTLEILGEGLGVSAAQLATPPESSFETGAWEAWRDTDQKTDWTIDGVTLPHAYAPVMAARRLLAVLSQHSEEKAEQEEEGGDVVDVVNWRGVRTAFRLAYWGADAVLNG